MRYIFFGTPEFAATILEKLINAGFVPQAVVCNPDRPVGRKKIITPPPVKQLIANRPEASASGRSYGAGKSQIEILQPEKLDSSFISVFSSLKIQTKNPAKNGALEESRDKPNNLRLTLNDSIGGYKKLSSMEIVDNSKGRGPAGNQTPETQVSTLSSDHPGPTADLLYQNWDFFVVAAYAKILPKEILEIPRLGAIGVHPSLLPKYRGPSPIQAAILNGDEETGVTLFLMDERVDHGEILRNEKLEIRDEDNYESLSKKTAELGAELLIQTLPKFIAGKIKTAPQDENEATYTKKFITENGFIEPADLEKAEKEGGEIAKIIERKIRALNPEPGIWTTKDGKRIKILEAELSSEGKLALKKIQFEGKNPVEI